MGRQAYKSKAHETFLAKHAYTSKGPNLSVEMVIKAIRKQKREWKCDDSKIEQTG